LVSSTSKTALIIGGVVLVIGFILFKGKLKNMITGELK
jgi:hypothetical protein